MQPFGDEPFCPCCDEENVARQQAIALAERLPVEGSRQARWTVHENGSVTWTIDVPRDEWEYFQFVFERLCKQTGQHLPPGKALVELCRRYLEQ